MKTNFKRSPWGSVQYQHTIIDGIVNVGTASHGGIKLSVIRQTAMPEYMRIANAWYEEDCDWARVYVVFAAEIKQYYQAHPENENTKYELRNLECAPECLKNWNPDAYEKFFGRQIPEGQSYLREHPLPKKLSI